MIKSIFSDFTPHNLQNNLHRSVYTILHVSEHHFLSCLKFRKFPGMQSAESPMRINSSLARELCQQTTFFSKKKSWGVRSGQAYGPKQVRGKTQVGVTIKWFIRTDTVWAGHVARMGEDRGAHRVLVGKAEGKRGHWGNQDVDGRIILRWIFRKLDGVVGTGWSWLRIGTGGHLWVRWGTFVFHKCGEFLD